MGIFNNHIHRRNGKSIYYDNPVVLSKEIDRYIESIVGVRVETDAEGKQIGFDIDDKVVWIDAPLKGGGIVRRYTKRPSVGGMCLFLGFATQSELVGLARHSNPLIRNVIMTALLWIQSFFAEESQRENAPSSTYQFLLSNMGFTTSKTPTEKELGTPTMTNVTEKKPVSFNLNFVRSERSLPDDVVKRQLLAHNAEYEEISCTVEDGVVVESELPN